MSNRSNAKPPMTEECYTCKPRDQQQRIYFSARLASLPTCRAQGHQIGPVQRRLPAVVRCMEPRGREWGLDYFCTLARGHAGDHNKCIVPRKGVRL